MEIIPIPLSRILFYSSRRDSFIVNCQFSIVFYGTAKKLLTVTMTPFSTFASMRNSPV